MVRRGVTVSGAAAWLADASAKQAERVARAAAQAV